MELNPWAKIVADAKDRLVEGAALPFLNQKIEKFGSVTGLHVDSTNKTMSVELALKGESSVVSIRVGAYEWLDEAGESRILLRDVEASREWIGAVLKEFVVGRPLKVPPMLRNAL